MRRLCCLLVLLLSSAASPQSPQCEMQIVVGKGKSLEVIIPCIGREQLIDITSSVLNKGDDAAKKRLQNALRDSGELTLTITTNKQ